MQCFMCTHLSVPRVLQFVGLQIVAVVLKGAQVLSDLRASEPHGGFWKLLALPGDL